MLLINAPELDIMSLPSTQELEAVIVDILSRARDDGRLSQLTVRIVRQELATHFDVEEDVLNSGKYKSLIKETVHATVNRLQNASDEVAEPPRRHATKKDKSDGTAKTGSRKRKSKVQVHLSDEEQAEEAGASESDAPPSKKASARSKPSKVRSCRDYDAMNQTFDKPVKPSKTSKKPESEMKYKSKAIIESSDEEAAPGSGTRTSVCSPKKEQMSAKSSPPKQKQQQRKVDKGDSDAQVDPGEGSGPSGSTSKLKRATESPKPSVSKANELTGDPMESELSSVIDEPPKKRQKKQEKQESVKPQKDEKIKRGKKKEALSKDEETVNKLKGIVVACGLRKVWKKEFEGLDKPSQQIKRLHSILGDLGMTPRYSLEKAKAIRERRELAQELQDVQEFAKATKRRGKGPRGSCETEESMAQGDSDADVPARKKKNAQASIMAFLQDQSEEE
ncbi:hypothetical protein J3R83DRAFT_8522 [Lanmaoa asiatica]|nr:hypothetical protein J3R83DRAFT_8522 [Lanmaoa asiatica]